MRKASYDELEAAASEINNEILESVKLSIALYCNEYIFWSKLFSDVLVKTQESELYKFARAFSLCLLGHLPINPETCPFCKQYGRNINCIGCGYALTHGRCDSEDSAFSQLIEAFQELGKAIYQSTGDLCCTPNVAKSVLEKSIHDSAESSRKMLVSLEKATALNLMELKAEYFHRTICLIPQNIFPEEISKRCILVREMLKNYW
jgi:hypothetical protein